MVRSILRASPDFRAWPCSWVAEQTRVSLGHVEQLYTFGDKGREAPAAVLAGGDGDARVVSVGYLALAPEPAKVAVRRAMAQLVRILPVGGLAARRTRHPQGRHHAGPWRVDGARGN
ncbi:MAG: hypothetical protein R3C42_07160 [Parvularculaceae bacterium]